MRKAWSIGRVVLTAAASTLVAPLSACSPGVKQEYDAGLERSVTRMSGNTVSEPLCLNQHTLALNGAMVEETDGPSYMLLAESRGPGWVRHEGLALRIDGAPVWVAESIPGESRVVCPSASGSNTNLPMSPGPACVYEEASWFPVPAIVLRRLARAGEASVRLQGANGDITRRFSRDNLEGFELFVAQHVR